MRQYEIDNREVLVQALNEPEYKLPYYYSFIKKKMPVIEDEVKNFFFYWTINLNKEIKTVPEQFQFEGYEDFKPSHVHTCIWCGWKFYKQRKQSNKPLRFCRNNCHTMWNRKERKNASLQMWEQDNNNG